MTNMHTPDAADSEEIPRELMRALSNEAVWADPPADLQERALGALRTARAASTPTPSIVSDPDEGTSVRTSDRPRARWLFSAAAAAAVIVGALTWTLVYDTPDRSLELAGTDLAATASAEVEITEKASGFEVILDIENIASASEGVFYQAWFKSDDGVLVTIGTFHARESGQDIVLWSGVDPDDYDLLTVTLQRVGDGAESSGQVVLSGPLDERAFHDVEQFSHIMGLGSRPSSVEPAKPQEKSCL